MTQPITPPPELVQQWVHDANLSRAPYSDEHWAYEQHIATRAAQWGSDQELKACCGWVAERLPHYPTIDKRLRNERRPKPSSLKLQALNDLNTAYDANKIEVTTYCNIRRALEQLDD